MFKFVVFSALIAVAACGYSSGLYASEPLYAAPYAAKTISYNVPTSVAQVKTVIEPSYSIVEQPTIEHVASKVSSIPTAVSHQSQTQYHSKQVVQPIYAHGVQKSVINTPITKQYIEQVPVLAKAVYAQPIVAKSIQYAAPLQYAPAPVHYQASPLQYAASPVHYAAPLQYAASPIYAPKVAQYAAYPQASYAYAPTSYSYQNSNSYPSASYAHPSAHAW
ncbi:unnamed protein product [Diamesa tonsa]